MYLESREFEEKIYLLKQENVYFDNIILPQDNNFLRSREMHNFFFVHREYKVTELIVYFGEFFSNR